MEAWRTKYLKKGFIITVLYPSRQPENGKRSVLYNVKCALRGSREFQTFREYLRCVDPRRTFAHYDLVDLNL
jgi:hypothetical protein